MSFLVSAWFHFILSALGSKEILPHHLRPLSHLFDFSLATISSKLIIYAKQETKAAVPG